MSLCFVSSSVFFDFLDDPFFWDPLNFTGDVFGAGEVGLGLFPLGVNMGLCKKESVVGAFAYSLFFFLDFFCFICQKSLTTFGS